MFIFIKNIYRFLELRIEEVNKKIMFSVFKCQRETFEIIKKFPIIILILIFLIFFRTRIEEEFTNIFINIIDRNSLEIFNLNNLQIIGFFCLVEVIVIICTYIFIKLAKKEVINFSNFIPKSIFSIIFKIFIINFLFAIVLVLMTLFCFFIFGMNKNTSFENSLSLNLFNLIYFFFYYYLFIKYFFSSYLIIEKNYSLFKALKGSANITKNSMLKLVLIFMIGFYGDSYSNPVIIVFFILFSCVIYKELCLIHEIKDK